ncbi:MAG TPA: isocitrate lyase/PEP mutase family protein [Nitrososphaerales archaeon]|nr:isocitrate lyase/PEP mutase family protein [Nitrososphaerales archaeon]
MKESEPRRKLREIIGRANCTAGVSVWDCLSARIAENEGIEFAQMGGALNSYSLIGKADIGYLTQTEMVEQAWRIVNSVSIPIIVDCDDGFGGPLNVRRTVRLLEQVGAAGLYIEDLVHTNKRSLHWSGGAIEPSDYMVQKLKTAVNARRDKDFVIIARTDLIEGFDEGLRRGKLYADAGADMVFMMGRLTKEQLTRAGKEIPVPLYQTCSAPLADGSVLSLDEYGSIGVKLVSYSSHLFSIAWKAYQEACRKLKITEKSKPPDTSPGFKFIYEIESILSVDEDLQVAGKKDSRPLILEADR